MNGAIDGCTRHPGNLEEVCTTPFQLSVPDQLRFLAPATKFEQITLERFSSEAAKVQVGLQSESGAGEPTLTQYEALMTGRINFVDGKPVISNLNLALVTP